MIVKLLEDDKNNQEHEVLGDEWQKKQQSYTFFFLLHSFRLVLFWRIYIYIYPSICAH